MTKSPWPSSTAANRWYVVPRPVYYELLFPVDFAYAGHKRSDRQGRVCSRPILAAGETRLSLATVLARLNGSSGHVIRMAFGCGTSVQAGLGIKYCLPCVKSRIFVWKWEKPVH